MDVLIASVAIGVVVAATTGFMTGGEAIWWVGLAIVPLMIVVAFGLGVIALTAWQVILFPVLAGVALALAWVTVRYLTNRPIRIVGLTVILGAHSAWLLYALAKMY